MMRRSSAYAVDNGLHPLRWPICISLVGHLVLFAFLIYKPVPDRSTNYLPSVIDVKMVDPSELNSEAPPSSEKPTEVPAEPEKPKEETAPEPEVQVKSTAEPEVSVAPPRKKTKTSMKHKTFKTRKVVKNALRRIEKEVETRPPKPLEDTIKRLRDKVAKESRPDATATMDTKVEGKGKKGGFVPNGSSKEAEMLDLYRLEIAHAINKNWAFSEQLAGDSPNLKASLVIKVMPDGSIVDIFFTDRSGNQILDESAYKAIVKSSPVTPHPPKLELPYVDVGLNFTPKGVQ